MNKYYIVNDGNDFKCFRKKSDAQKIIDEKEYAVNQIFELKTDAKQFVGLLYNEKNEKRIAVGLNPILALEEIKWIFENDLEVMKEKGWTNGFKAKMEWIEMIERMIEQNKHNKNFSFKDVKNFVDGNFLGEVEISKTFKIENLKENDNKKDMKKRINGR